MSNNETLETHEGRNEMTSNNHATEGMDNQSSLLEAALAYAQQGWPVMPLWEIKDGHCACGKSDCSSPGKHPRTKHGVKDATTNPSQIEEWWTQWPEVNIGIATGEPSGLLVIDVDPRHGGDQSLKDLEEEHGSLPHTVESITGGDGRHFYFANPQDVTIRNSVEQLGKGLDIRCVGGSIIAPPSEHVSGKQYLWKEGHGPEEIALAEPPAWLLELCQQPKTSHTSEATSPLPRENRYAPSPPGSRRLSYKRSLSCRLRWDPANLRSLLAGC